MRLNDKDFARFKELQGKKDLTKDEQVELTKLAKLKAKSSSKSSDKLTGKKFTPGNDFSWWNKFSELMKDAANMRANWIPGTDIIRSDGFAAGTPGVVKFTMFDTYGAEVSATSPINAATRDLFLKMFQKYRGITRYQAADLGIINIASVEVIKTVAWLERIYGIINRYSKKNWNLPYTELEALGINQSHADYIRNHLSDYRAALNDLIRKGQRLCVPKDIAILADKISLYGYEYKDHESDKAQIILFDMKYVGVFDEELLDTGSAIRFRDFVACDSQQSGTSEPMDCMIYLRDFDGAGAVSFPVLTAMMESLLSSDSVQTIYGDLMAWFGEEQLLVLQFLPEDYVVMPVYSKSILHKVHNMDILAGSSDAGQPVVSGTQIRCAMPASLSQDNRNAIVSESAYVIYQNDNVIYTRFSLSPGASEDMVFDSDTQTWYIVSGSGVNHGYPLMNINKRVLDSYTEDWNDELVCEGAMWKIFLTCVVAEVSGEDRYTWVPELIGYEMCLNCKVYTRKSNGVISSNTLPISNYYTANNTRATEVLLLQSIDWAPIMYEVNRSALEDISFENLSIPSFVLGDIENLRVVTAEDLRWVFNAFVLSGITSDIRPKV